MSTEGPTARGGVGESTRQGPPSETQSEQYSLAKILVIWTLAAAPMGILSWMGWIFSSSLALQLGLDYLGAFAMRLALITLGLIWLFVLSMIIVRREEGDLRWVTVKRRLSLNAPRNPTTGQPRARLWLWVVPFLVAVGVVKLVLYTPVESAWVSVFPFIAQPQGYGFDMMFGFQDILETLDGAWWFLTLFVVFAVSNKILAEEFLFRGVLLPRMEGVFGCWSWVANGILFGLYHVHQPWVIPNAVVAGFLYAFPAYRYRSTWMSIIVHSAQGVYFAFFVLEVALRMECVHRLVCAGLVVLRL